MEAVGVAGALNGGRGKIARVIPVVRGDKVASESETA